ncbi:MAG: PEP/pyruvate-binding domain-containing protein [Dehalococcoidia bacterium]
MRYIVPFQGDPRATQVDAVGGKGANLGVLTSAGLPVPPGFTVATDAYRRFIECNGLGARISETVADLAHDDVDAIERATAALRVAIENARMPGDVAAEIAEAYAGMAGEPYVAVRSSGTAEDMTGASFAGLHDTYLDVRGEAQVIDAVKRCWASMWSARATSYRRTQGFEQGSVAIAIVVQVMVESEVSGVMFTANPLEGRTDEIVVNASFGLGEAIVAGLVTPDAVTLDLATLHVKKRVLGSKERRIVRAPGRGEGTVEQLVAEADRNRDCLDDDAVAALGTLGRRIMAHYGGLPQDIEWAFARGEFYVLQARPVTGVEFLWDDSLEAGVQNAPEDPQTIWTQKWAEMYWTGGITPLFYSVRGRHFRKGIQFMLDLAGFHQLERVRYFEARGGTVYYNADFHRTFTLWALPKFARSAAMIDILPDAWIPEVAAAPVKLWKYLCMLVRVNSSSDASFFNWQRTMREWIEHRIAEADGLADDALRELSDEELKCYAFQQEEVQRKFSDPLWVGFNIAAPHLLGLFMAMVSRWYAGENKLIVQDLISGNPAQSLQSREMHELFRLAAAIRESEVLTRLFRENEGTAFFEQLRSCEEGRRFLQQYEAFVASHGHRGQADRDIYYLRRAEDPRLDYEAFRSLLGSPDFTPPWEIEGRVCRKREEATADVLEHIRRQPFAGLKAWAFRLVQQKILDFLLLRDDWRHYADRITYSKRRAFLEVGCRAVARGRLATVNDCFFLSDAELYDVLDGRDSPPLTRAKIAARREAFERVDSRRESPPVYLRGRTPVALDSAQASGDALAGIGISAGTATGRARVVPDLRGIGRVERGDILICNATDPGWAAVFTLIHGLVIETGGMLAHGACLSREHGIPAVQLRNAMRLIPDGARVRIRGDTGELVILEA